MIPKVSESRERQSQLIGASVVAREIGVPTQVVVNDIQSGIDGKNFAAFSGGHLPIIGWCVEAWEMAGDRPTYHAKRLSGGSSAQRIQEGEK